MRTEDKKDGPNPVYKIDSNEEWKKIAKLIDEGDKKLEQRSTNET